MNEKLADLVCPACAQPFGLQTENVWKCKHCGFELPTHEGIPLFSAIAPDMLPFDKRIRGPDVGTPWRIANWKFLVSQVTELEENSLILDVGAGRGDFSEIFINHRTVSLDVYPYPEVDIVCDLTETNPFPDNYFDAIALMNVVEHVYNPRPLFAALHRILKPGGVLWITVPFLLKIHQSPFDFFRYTHYALKQMAMDSGFVIDEISGYYDPIFLVGEGLRNIQFWELGRLNRFPRLLVRLFLLLIKPLINGISIFIGKGRVTDVKTGPAPIGYLLVLRKH